LLRRTLNLGILAHVDAGKTTLTERLLYAAGVIDAVGSVDHGTTQTDSLPLEQRRGITIKSAVVSFAIDDVIVNLIDTPGHPDFIAEVERVLGVLDGAVLVVSAVEGVQAQTPLLMRALQRLRVPTLLFVNKLDRDGADVARVVQEMKERLTPSIVAMPDGADVSFEDRLVSLLAEHDERLLSAYVEGEAKLSESELRQELTTQTARTLLHPAFSGSAKTGVGIGTLMSGIAELLPAREGDADGPVSGTVFKIERGGAGEKVAYVRMFSGTVCTRDRVRFGKDQERKVTAISVFDDGAVNQRPAFSAGEIAKLWGLDEVQIGDAIGEPHARAQRHFPRPSLETVVVPASADAGHALQMALVQLAEQDPLIDVRQDDVRSELSVSLYGEVQKEVIQATLAEEFGVTAAFRETTTICVERPTGVGEAVEFFHDEGNPLWATIGLRVSPTAPGFGSDFRIDIDRQTAPLHAYKRFESFAESMERYVREALQEGLFGWEVIDCSVAMTQHGYASSDGPASKRGPLSTAADYRKLTPLVLMQALERAGTVVCEPIHRFHLELPGNTLPAVFSELARLGATGETPAMRRSWAIMEGEVAAARMHDLQRRLARLTRGEGVLELAFDRYEPVDGTPPMRPRVGPNPLDRREYLLRVTRPHLTRTGARGRA
jgi:ribosomal protection tetracycline resistance protein